MDKMDTNPCLQEPYDQEGGSESYIECQMVINRWKRMKQGGKVGNAGREESLLYVREGISMREAFIEQMIFEQRPGGSEGATV